MKITGNFDDFLALRTPFAMLLREFSGFKEENRHFPGHFRKFSESESGLGRIHDFQQYGTGNYVDNGHYE